jgi:isopenicillin-N epimerase
MTEARARPPSDGFPRRSAIIAGTMRDCFLLDPNVVFLNHGSFGALPKSVFEAQRRWQLEMERNPVEFLGRRSGALLASARARLAAELGARGEDLVFVTNATTGVNVVAQSLALQPGDEVLTTDQEYGACVAAWERACAARGARLRRVVVPLPFEPEQLLESLRAALNEHTRLVYFSHVTSTTALTLPAAAICALARAHGVPVLVDGAHAPGQMPLALDALGADYYTGNCHKWLCAPKGSAFLHVRPERQDGIHATVVSWGYVAEGLGGHHGFDAFVGAEPLARRLQWQGTRDVSANLAVTAALDFRAGHDWAAMQQQCRAMARELQAEVLARNGLEPIAAEQDLAPQMVPLPVRATDAEGLRRRLFEQHRIEVPVTQHGERTFVRVSVQVYNTRADLARLCAALGEAGV